MPVQPNYPGVYVVEAPSNVRTIAGVATSVTAFVGRTKRGPVNEPNICFKFGDFGRRFGGLWVDGPLSYSVDDFFANGGGQAVIVRLFKANGVGDDGVAKLTAGNLELTAASPGDWGNKLKAVISYPTDASAATDVAARYGITAADLFDLAVTDRGTDMREVFRNVSVHANAGARRVDRVLAAESNLARVKLDANGNAVLPGARPADAAEDEGAGGNDGQALGNTDVIGEEDKKTGIYALLKTDIFNLLVIPPQTRNGTTDKAIWEKAAAFCARRRAFLLVDPPAAWDANPDTAAQTVQTAQINSPIISLTNASHAALFFPRIRKRDPLRDGQMDTFVPSGVIAGVMARVDNNRGVWKAPAGIEASMSGTEELTVKLTDDENGLLNPIGVNCLRSFPNVGRVVWGSRTLRGGDALSDDYKYIPVRRLALFIEESLYRGTQWAVFMPNDEPLWAQLRLNVGAFMQRLFRQGAFQGSSPREAYFVKCDSETTTQDDINRGIVNVVVGFAPLQPAEFVIITIQQIRNT
ncbi:phage tail sheath family protein [Rhizobium terrae]|uniref:phage tail sheath family protein n=1 Tax=Rhizobium terrae TaxID=2171756 RepID=UPI000E3C7368|nr:phage tail sheath C-terminal domain-containing protein [Rhizobium terrae]